MYDAEGGLAKYYIRRMIKQMVPVTNGAASVAELLSASTRWLQPKPKNFEAGFIITSRRAFKVSSAEEDTFRESLRGFKFPEIKDPRPHAAIPSLAKPGFLICSFSFFSINEMRFSDALKPYRLETLSERRRQTYACDPTSCGPLCRNQNHFLPAFWHPDFAHPASTRPHPTADEIDSYVILSWRHCVVSCPQLTKNETTLILYRPARNLVQ